MTKWDERYQTEEYIFGTEPNEFIARIQPYLPTSGRALDLATGEGRNGIFLARHGLETEGEDLSLKLDCEKHKRWRISIRYHSRRD